ncbi:KinB-signaling pathway activation protein [Metabacillus fastidiosus]|uniref:KinB-signaling pathway activation protein n=1 Tax=Metabacillus fastidiosus TaxID=1458 RepID=UPI002E1E279D|nr:KinB-signaling pathway activation protein [Metabacillus fastidiosus]
MKSRNWVRLFLSTLFIGGIVTILLGFILKWSEYKELFITMNVTEILSIAFWLLGLGCIFSIISQMGFFAYLTVHRFGLGIFRTVTLWNGAQIILIIFVFFDLIYLRYKFFAESGDSIFPYILLTVFTFLFSCVVAYMKKRQTNKAAFVPALFFMFVITTIEWFPALRVNEADWLYLMLIPLLICNAYQLLILPKLTGEKNKNA